MKSNEEEVDETWGINAEAELGNYLKKQPKFVPYKYWYQGDWKDWVKFYEQRVG